ncbi:MAG TPA: penicillin acylase family protein [Herpetosiphonaceae bacterium]
MKRALRILRWIMLLLVIVILAAGVGGYGYTRRSLPAYDGTTTVVGISAPVEIRRDRDAVPHIYAQNQPDAFFGLGYVHAQDRLWQMEFQRRVGQGRLSEVLGAPTIRADRLMRTLGVYRAAQRSWEAQQAETKAIVTAYAAGINAFIAGHSGSRLPPEFTIFGIAPEPWTGPDVLVWAKMLAWDLGGVGADDELFRTSVVEAVGVERAQELIPEYAEDGLSIVASGAGGPTSQARRWLDGYTSGDERAAIDHRTYESILDLEAELRPWLRSIGRSQPAIGSNNWVVAGGRSTTGAPLLANDPHLQSSTPATWYLAHLSAGDLDVIGATLPGLPAVVIGRNRAIAWGVTNTNPDVADFFRERLDADGKMAEFQGQMEPLEVYTETLRVKGQADLVETVRVSRHGPLMSDAINANAVGTAAASLPPLEPLALQWTGLDPADTTLEAFLGINQAQNWEQFKAALGKYIAPVQNFVYADVAGNIGYYAPGRMPIRAGDNTSLPAEGWSGSNEWTGYVPFAELPQLYNPPEQFIVTANNRPADSAYPYFLGRNWYRPYRAQRITDLLQAKDKLSPDDFAAIQADTVSPLARQLVPQLLPLVAPQTEQERQAIAALQAWDGDTRGDSVAAAIFAAWFRRLPTALVADELGDRTAGRYQTHIEGYVGEFVARTLADRENPWCDNVTTESAENCADIAGETFRAALTELQAALGDDLNSWRWDRLHRAVFPHQTFGGVPVVDRIFSRSIPNGGDWTSVNVGPYDLSAAFDQSSVPSYRQIIDLGSADGGRFIQPLGQSGHVLSPHYDDYLADWQAVRYRPMRFDREAVVSDQLGLLELVPEVE